MRLPSWVTDFWAPRPSAKLDGNLTETQGWYEALPAAAAPPPARVEAALQHARDAWAEQLHVHEALDRKAEWTLGLAGAAAAVTYSLAPQGVWAWTSLPSLVCFACSMYLALRVRLPGDRSAPYTPRDVLESGGPDANVELLLTASFHAATLLVRRLGGWKASLVRSAGVWLVFGVLGLAFPLACRWPAQLSPEPPPAASAARLACSFDTGGAKVFFAAGGCECCTMLAAGASGGGAVGGGDAGAGPPLGGWLEFSGIVPPLLS